jgi:N-glycosylase/DNA lyase
VAKKGLMKWTEIDAPDFDLAMTLGSGQVFHWDKTGTGFYGTIGDEAVWVEQRGVTLRMSRGCADLVRNYFALDHPLAQICAAFPRDAVMDEARDFCRGLRIIRQPKWECLATFICSSMKQVAHIRQITRKLRERFGEARSPRQVRPVADKIGKDIVYTFPSAARMAESSEKELRECALGYRAKNLLATARLAASGEADLGKWATLSDIDLRTKLCEMPGVGAKVANCVMLFAYERLGAFPIDVWIERILRAKYFARNKRVTANGLRAFVEAHFGEHGGYAQQYLFHYARMSSRKSGKRKRLIPSVPLTGPSASPSMSRLPKSLYSSSPSRTGVLLGMPTEEVQTSSHGRKNKRLAGKVLNRRANTLSKIDRVKRPNL